MTLMMMMMIKWQVKCGCHENGRRTENIKSGQYLFVLLIFRTDEHTWNLHSLTVKLQGQLSGSGGL
jgi:hypothetical protein